MFVHVFFLKEIIGIRFAPCLRAKLSARGGSFSAPVLHGAAPSPAAQPFSSRPRPRTRIRYASTDVDLLKVKY